MARWSWRRQFQVSSNRVARAAVALLIVRVIEGLGAWLFFNEFFLAVTPVPWVVQASFVAYFLLNLRLSQHYRRGRTATSLLVTDVLVNVGLLAFPVAASGGLASPLLLVFPLKSIHYAMVFNEAWAAAFVGVSGVMLVIIWAVQLADLLPVIPLALLGPKNAHSAVKFAILGIFLVVPVATAWLRRAIGDPVATLRTTATAARGEAHSMVAGVLLRVSEAVSRLTRLDEILETVVEIAPQSIDMDYCGILLWREDSGEYRGAAAAGAGPQMARGFSRMRLSPEDVPDYEWSRRLGHCVVASAADSEHVSALDVQAVLVAPLLSGDRFYGIMEFARRRTPVGFTQRDLTIADGIARQTAVALQRAQLIEESRRLVRAVESTDDGVLITDPERRVIFANRGFLQTMGYRREEVVGHDASEFAIGPEGWLATISEAVQQRGWRGETVAYRKDGTEFPILLNAGLIRDDDGAVQGAVAILQDISEEKRFQQQMQRADRLVAVGEMAAGIAHEVNNALTVIFGQTAEAAERSDGQLRAALTEVDGQARRIADIVQGVLGFARPHAPKRRLIDLAKVTRQTIDLIRHDIERQGVQLEVDCESELPAVMADPQQLQQILLNLFGNALQAMAPCERRWLGVEVRGVGERLVISVRDAGPGIPQEIMARIFDPFFSTKDDGNGLGLSVSYAIAQAHGGDLQVESKVGEGAVFSLSLPIRGPEADALDEAEVGRDFERVLLVDDDPDVAEALTSMLRREGIKVLHAGTGAEALLLLDRGDWDAVFLDVRLPGMSGPEIYDELARRRPDLAPRVVFVTGGLWRSHSRLREELPPQPILPKPCTQDQVREVLRRLRTQRRAAA